MKKALKIFATSLLAVIIAAVVAAAIVWRGEISTLCTLSQVGDNEYLYQMEYKAPYDLDDLIVHDVATNSDLVKYAVSKIGKGLPIGGSSDIKSQSMSSNDEESIDEHCTSYQAFKADGEGFWYGRNYDFFKNPSLVLTSHPKTGYASISVCDLAHLGFNLEKLPNKLANKVLCLALIYAPMDGINEKGLCTSIMALPKQPAQQNSGKHKVGTSVLMRLFLDKCATVDEVVELVESLDVNHDVAAGSGYHYMVADAQGNAAAIEFDREDGWKTMIVRKDEDARYMVVTNHLLSPKYYTTEPDIYVGNPHSRSWWRYETISAYLDDHNGVLTRDEAQEALAIVHWKDLVWDNGMVEDTQYSNVYDQKNIKLYLRPWNDYDTTSEFGL